MASFTLVHITRYCYSAKIKTYETGELCGKQGSDKNTSVDKKIILICILNKMLGCGLASVIDF